MSVHCVRPTRGDIDETVELPGRAVPPPGGDLPVASQVGGRIVDVLVHEGDRISAGTVIANVDDVASRDAVRQAEAQLAQATASELNANATLERTRTLVTRGIAARQELDDATAKAETEKQAVASARAALDLARRTLGRVQVRAALSGVVTTVWRGPGALVDGSAATPIVQVAGAGVEFLADATERDLASIQPGQRATIELGAPPSLVGVVRTLSSALDPSTGLGSVRIGLEAAAAPPLLGSHGRARVVTAHRTGVLLLPANTLRGAVADGAEVAVCDGTHAAIRAVHVGYRDDQRFEVTSGLGEGDEVAVDHVLGLDEGTPLNRLP